MPNPGRSVPKRSSVEGTLHILLLTTGSVASVKAPLIVKELLNYEKTQVQVVSTKPSMHFFDADALEADNVATGVKVWKDEDEWDTWDRMGDPVLHIELRRWADVVLLAPCSANTLAKLAAGLCDNLLTSLLRALTSETSKHLFPAMNTCMYLHPHTASHLSVAEQLGWEVGQPESKALACGDVGMGAMMDWRDICLLVAGRYGRNRKAGAPEVPRKVPVVDGITAAPKLEVEQTV
ncbi:flavo protein [Dacryopinax primogenitus]|uniref:Flavo protein n=1 Tax=Dacryopinax primogenitus (strain DJM 731) TaxID=1858805 RepID=M5FTJ8_DACPD|nr:flavo protein [Dacryopinax primogenitus]EJT98709.1 flavo protein [Dacryopinax primogenitus]